MEVLISRSLYQVAVVLGDNRERVGSLHASHSNNHASLSAARTINALRVVSSTVSGVPPSGGVSVV